MELQSHLFVEELGRGGKERQRGEEGREKKGEMGEGEVRGREKRFRKHVGRERERDGYGALRKHIVVHQRRTLAQSLQEYSAEPCVYPALLRD